MPEKLLDTVSKLLLAVLPDSDLGKIVGIILIGFFLLILTGRFKLEWIGAATLYIWRRFVRCPLGKHSYYLSGVGSIDLIRGGGITGPYKCRYCGKQDHFEGV